MLNIYDTFIKLRAVRSASGSESEVMKVISEIAAPYADEITSDPLGNLIVRTKSDNPDAKKIMFAAHADEIGLVFSSAEENGFLRVCAVGGINPLIAFGQQFIFPNDVRGVFYGEKGQESAMSDCYLDIGAKTAEEALSMVSIGDVAGYAAPSFRMGDLIVSPYLDDKISCAVLLSALSASSRVNDVYYVFTVQEEVGSRGAKTAAYSITPDYGIIVDVTPAYDMPPIKKNTHICVGKGPTNKFLDNSLISSSFMTELIRETAVSENITLQNEVLTRGGTDGGMIQRSRGGVMTGGVSIPTRYIHSPIETASENDCVKAARLISAIAGRIINKR